MILGKQRNKIYLKIQRINHLNGIRDSFIIEFYQYPQNNNSFGNSFHKLIYKQNVFVNNNAMTFDNSME